MIKSNGEYSSPRYLSELLDTNGNGTGTINAIGNYSDAGLGATTFYIQPPVGQLYYLDRILVHVEDVGTFVPSLYGKDIVLTNGLTIDCVINGEIIDLTANHRIKTNSEWAMFCFDLTLDAKGGAGTNFMHVRWSFNKSKSIILNGNTNDVFRLTLNDNFNGLVTQHFVVQGVG